MPTATPVIRIVDSPEALAGEAAKDFVRLARESALAEGEFSVALAGGSTPRRLYELLASEKFSRRGSVESGSFLLGR